MLQNDYFPYIIYYSQTLKSWQVRTEEKGLYVSSHTSKPICQQYIKSLQADMEGPS